MKNTILEISRQNLKAPLSPFFDAALNAAIENDFFPTEEHLGTIRADIVQRLASYRVASGRDVVVMGISGGVDSALTAALFKEAGWTVKGFLMPILQDSTETARGIETCEALGISGETNDLTDEYLVMSRNVVGDGIEEKIRRGNIRARLRMINLYDHAQRLGGIVASTDNLSELQAGFWTINGDVGDVAPIQALTKSYEVPMLAKMVGVPESVWKAVPTDGLGISDGDEAQLGVSYLQWDLAAYVLTHFSDVNSEFLSDYQDFGMDEPLFSDEDIDLDSLDPADKADLKKVLDRMARTRYKRAGTICFEHTSQPRLSDQRQWDQATFSQQHDFALDGTANLEIG